MIDIGRILRLTLLAPDVIVAIPRGDESSRLSLERLSKRLGFSPLRSTDDQHPEHAQV